MKNVTKSSKIFLVVSSDLNGTLIHPHSMSELILKYLDEEKFKIAKKYFKKQTSGTATMKTTFSEACPLTKGLTLKDSIEYTLDFMKYVDGFDEFIKTLHENSIPLVINSTGYSVTIESIRYSKGEKYFHGYIGNTLKFCDYSKEKEKVLNDEELSDCVKKYFNKKGKDIDYSNIKANGEHHLGIVDEDGKVEMMKEYCKKNFPGLKPSQIIHIGDTMGDSMAILRVAKEGGIGIAFNYNEQLKIFLREKILEDPKLKDKIFFVDEKSEFSNISKVLPIILKKLEHFE